MKRDRVPRIAGLAVAAVAALLLSACAPEPVSGWTPRQWDVEGAVVDTPLEMPAPEAAPTVDMRLRNDEVGVDVRWAYLQQDHPFNAAVDSFVRDAVQTRSGETGVAYRPMAYPAGAGLGERGCQPDETTKPASEILGARVGTVVVCEIVMAQGPVIAEALRRLSTLSDGTISDTTKTIYANIATGEVATESEFFTDPAAVWPVYVDVLRREMGSLSVSPVTDPTEEQLGVLGEALAQSGFGGGEVSIPVPASLSARELDGLAAWRERPRDKPLFVELSATEIADALSPFAQAVAQASGEFEGQPSGGAGFWRVPCDLVPCMAMTLDDGPSALTPGFLDVLRDNQSAATFFMVGLHAQDYPDIVRRVAAEGHQIGNHTWDHSYLTTLTNEQIQSQLSSTAAVLRELSGQPVNTFRPPGGFVSDRVVAAAGLPAIMWSVDTRDWEHPPDDVLARYAIDTPNISTIILMHDVQEGSSRVFAQVIEGLRDRGFSLVTIDALFDGSVPNGIVRHGPLE